MRRIVILFLCIVISVAALIGCGNGTRSEDASRMKIAIVTSPSGVDDGGFNMDNYKGILAFIEENPHAAVSAIKEESGDVTAAVAAVADVVADYDVIVCCGFQFAGIGDIARENPDVDFILVDSHPFGDDGKETQEDNIYAMLFKEEEGGFCAGMAAALESRTGKVAVVGGIAYPSNVNYQYGFMSGVNYANRHYGTEVRIVELSSYAGTDAAGANVGGNYVGSFADEATGKVVGQALIDAGCDVILVAAGASGNGVFTAAKEAGNVFCIGCDVDQFDEGSNGSDNIILTSCVKAMGDNVKKQLENVKAGTFKGENVLLGAAADSIGYVKTVGRHQLSEETVERIDEAFAKLRAGEIVPPSSSNGMTPDDFTGL